MKSVYLSQFLLERGKIFAISFSFFLHLIFFLALHFSSQHVISPYEGAVRIKIASTSFREQRTPPQMKTEGEGISNKGLVAVGEKLSFEKGEKVKVKKTGSSSKSAGGDVLSILREIEKTSSKEVSKSSGIFSGGFSLGGEIRSGGRDYISSSIWDEYISTLWERVKRNWTPPPQKSLMAVIVVKIGKDGWIKEIEIEKSSGSPTYDRRALEAIKASSPFPSPPSGDDVEIGFRFISE